MAGLSQSEFNQIEAQHMTAIISELNATRWEWVVVLTVANLPGCAFPRFANCQSLVEAYSRFRKALAAKLQTPIKDFWIVERGKQNGRIHINALFEFGKTPPPNLFTQTWMEIASSSAHPLPFDPKKGVAYWVKDITLHHDIVLYGGSAVMGEGCTQTGPQRRRKSYYNDARQRVRYRVQPGSFIKQQDTSVAVTTFTS